MKKRPIIQILGLFSLISINFMACAEIDEVKKGPLVRKPIMVFRGDTRLDYHEENKLAWELYTEYMERWDRPEKIFVRPMEIRIYDSLGKYAAGIQADSAILDSGRNWVYAYGNVRARTPDGASIRTDSMVWSKKGDTATINGQKRKVSIWTDAPVRVVSEFGDVLAGTGLVSDDKLEEWKFKGNVRGIFQEAEGRMRKEGER